MPLTDKPASKETVQPAKEVTSPLEARKTAPDVDVLDEVYRDPGARLIEKAKKRLGEKAVGMHFFLSDGLKPSGYYERQGYIGVWTVIGEDKEMWCDRGDPLLMRPDADFQREFIASAQIARAQAKNAMDGADDKYAVRDADGRVHRLVKE